MSGFAGAGIRRRHFEAAIVAFQNGVDVSPSNFSTSTYVVTKDGCLWDLKALVVKASEISWAAGERDEPISSSDFVTRRYYHALYDFGYAILVFKVRKARPLGLRGFDALALNDEHRVHSSLNDVGDLNFFRQSAQDIVAGAPLQVEGKTRRFVRNTDLVRQVLLGAKGVCACCGGRAFQTHAGYWFLEVHHKRWLSENGPDAIENMVALCPNCHRREHHGIERKYK